ncbi:peptidoglycan-binding domain-containing protein [Streptomyces sp. NPDC051742]|uniref:peptidoglycan-binding domain-containing protein n=1 Tax=unclassified Streptomyces TaxID=2593676 RepID=UPI00342F4B58
MQRVTRTLRLRTGVMGVLALLFAAGLTASPVMTAPAHAAYGLCNTTSWRDVPTLGGTSNEYRVPARTDNGLSCYLRYFEGSSAAVEELQKAIIICYGGTWASQRISNSGGADGVYGTGTVEAVKWLQINKLGLSGSADGVYGPDTRSRMLWPHYYDRGALLYSCTNPSTF